MRCLIQAANTDKPRHGHRKIPLTVPDELQHIIDSHDIDVFYHPFGTGKPTIEISQDAPKPFQKPEFLPPDAVYVVPVNCTLGHLPKAVDKRFIDGAVIVAYAQRTYYFLP